MTQHFDIAIVGGGAAGCAAAVEAARSGARVALIERERLLGGATWHRGRLPARMLQVAVRQLRASGPITGDPSEIELARLLPDLDAHRHQRAAQLAAQVKDSGALRLHARAQLVGPHEIELTSVRGTQHRISARTTILAVGDQPRSLRGARIDHEAILDIGSVLSAVYLPRSVVVAGQTASAVEMAGLLVHLGCEVTLAVPGDRVLPGMDSVLAEAFLTAFRAAGGRVLWRHTVSRAQKDGSGGARCRLISDGTEAPIDLNPDRVVVAGKRRASVRGLGLDGIGLPLDSRGYLEVDSHFRTVLPSVRAVGAAIGTGSCPDRAIHQALHAVHRALELRGSPARPDRPFVETVLSVPELASIGSAESAQHSGLTSTVIDHTAGLKLVADTDHCVVGLHAWGPGAEERLRAQAPAVQERWTLRRLSGETGAAHERSRQAATALLSHGRAGGEVLLDPDDILAGIVQLPESTSAA